MLSINCLLSHSNSECGESVSLYLCGIFVYVCLSVCWYSCNATLIHASLLKYFLNRNGTIKPFVDQFSILWSNEFTSTLLSITLKTFKFDWIYMKWVRFFCLKMGHNFDCDFDFWHSLLCKFGHQTVSNLVECWPS